MVTAVLFDMDGVLIESERYINQAAIQFFANMGVKVKPDDFIPFVGSGEDRYIGGVAELYGIEVDLEQAKVETYGIYEHLIEKSNDAVLPVHRFLQNLHQAGIPMAVATSADKMKLDVNLRIASLQEHWFGALVHGKDVKKKKPFPDIYRLAAERLGVDIAGCVVFEDALNGIQAAKSAGALCVGVATSFSTEQLRAAGADAVVSTLDEIGDFSNSQEFEHLLLLMRARSAATAARENAYTPYSHFNVGAAVVSAQTGAIYSGCNVENSSYGATICAERGAIMKAVSMEKDFSAALVVVVSDDKPPAPPCAVCLQVLAEFCQVETEVVLCDLYDICLHYTFKELLPHPFIFPTQRGKRQ